MYFHLHSNIIITTGKKRSLISDLFNQNSLLIPNSLARFIKTSEKKSKVDILNLFGVENSETVNEYINWLEKRLFIEWFEQKETISLFPKLDTQWNIPFVLGNMIIDVNQKTHDWELIIKQINHLKIPVLQLRFYSLINYKELDSILLHTKYCSLKGIEIILPFNKEFTEDVIESFLAENIRIFQIVFFNSIKNYANENLSKKLTCNIVYNSNNLLSIHNCGVINENYFTTNIDLFNEGLAHNSCLNRKISIDANGEIKNCPSMSKSFGNIKDTTLEEALNKSGFKKYWNITKSQISICKECEFRNVCTDCRAYLQDPNDIYSKPLKCGYDPYTCEWGDWSTNPLSKTAIENYGMHELVKKKAI
jgi:SPASM domain peptide maturase of grasp-with-spasm system